jgi:RNA polymerase sigma-70 factor (ECF subfamily)
MTGRDPMPVTGLKDLEKLLVTPRAAGWPRDDSSLAVEVRALVANGDLPAARDRFAEIVRKHQRRASHVAFHYLRDGADADEATQDAFVKAFVHIESFRPEHSFEVWFTRILVNGCLDRRRARQRRQRWLLPVLDGEHGETNVVDQAPALSADPEQALRARERRAEIAGAVRKLPPQQRTVFLLCAYGGHSTREAAAITDLSESTIRVHLFRAVRKLRIALKAGLHVD